MFKKLASLLFEEEEILPEEIEDEKADLRKEKSSDSIFSKKKNDQQPLISDPLERNKKSSFENIVADDHTLEVESLGKEDFNTETKEPVKTLMPSFSDRKPQVSKEVYEFKPVISPMFGIAESEKEHSRPTFVQTAEVKNDSHLQTVISPYYGAIHKDMKTGPEYQQSPISMEPTQILVKAKVAQYVEEKQVVEIKNISLEELIQPSPLLVSPEVTTVESQSEEKLEDVTQFSLFGED